VIGHGILRSGVKAIAGTDILLKIDMDERSKWMTGRKSAGFYVMMEISHTKTESCDT
jgi:hypothetical protein